MTIQDVGSIGELIAAVATVVTLAYLAVQIRQNTESLRLGSELELGNQVLDWHARITSQPELIRIWDPAVDPASMSPEDKARFVWLVAEAFLIYETQYEFYRKGRISEEAWQPKIRSILGLLENPVVEKWWEARMTPLGGEFRRYLESLRDSQAPSWTHRPVASGEPLQPL